MSSKSSLALLVVCEQRPSGKYLLWRGHFQCAAQTHTGYIIGYTFALFYGIIPAVLIFLLSLIMYVRMRRLSAAVEPNTVSSTMEKQRKSVTIMLASATAVFLLTMVPGSINFLTKNAMLHPYSTVTCTLKQIALLNNVINFPLYVLNGKTFRNQFLIMMGAKRASDSDKGGTSMATKITNP